MQLRSKRARIISPSRQGWQQKERPTRGRPFLFIFDKYYNRTKLLRVVEGFSDRHTESNTTVISTVESSSLGEAMRNGALVPQTLAAHTPMPKETNKRGADQTPSKEDDVKVKKQKR